MATCEGKSCPDRPQDPIPASLLTIFLTFSMCPSCGQAYTWCLICKMENVTAQYCNTNTRLIYAASLISSTNQLSGLCENLDSAYVGLERSSR